MTTAVRRIVQSQKTFMNHLADEEAHLALQAQGSTSQSVQTPSQQTTTASRRPSTKGRRTKSIGMTPVTPHAQSFPTTALPSASLTSPPSGLTPESMVMPGGDETNPLLKTYTPIRPPTPVLEEILSAPPLPYAGARSRPSTLGHPPRQFCEICGYWGKVKCLKCGARVCGLECKGTHDEQRCPKFFA